LIQQLDELRELTGQSGVLQLLEMIFHRTGFQSLASRWGKPSSTRETMNRLIGLAGDYNSVCSQQNRIQGMLGFIRFVEDAVSAKSKDELMGEGVNVMTYHGASE